MCAFQLPSLHTQVYYKEAVAAFIVFDITRQKTFEDVMSWKTDVDQKVFLPDEKPVPVILLANKVINIISIVTRCILLFFPSSPFYHPPPPPPTPLPSS